MRAAAADATATARGQLFFFWDFSWQPDDQLDVLICLIIELERIGDDFRFWGCHIQHWPGAARWNGSLQILEMKSPSFAISGRKGVAF
jgi:hypothetical protein